MEFLRKRFVVFLVKRKGRHFDRFLIRYGTEYGFLNGQVIHEYYIVAVRFKIFAFSVCVEDLRKFF